MNQKNKKWTVEIEVADIWIEDGFNLNEERLQEVVNSLLPYARPDEVKTRIVSGKG